MRSNRGGGAMEDAAANQDDSAGADKEDENGFDCYETSDVEIVGRKDRQQKDSGDQHDEDEQDQCEPGDPNEHELEGKYGEDVDDGEGKYREPAVQETNKKKQRKIKGAQKKGTKKEYLDERNDDEDVQCEQNDPSEHGTEEEDDDEDFDAENEDSEQDDPETSIKRHVKRKRVQRKEKSSLEQINSRSSVKAIFGLVSKLPTQKKKLVREIEFDGILHLPNVTKANRKFSMWIFDHVDEMTSSISIDHHRDYKFDDEDMHKVMGVPAGGTRIERHCPEHKEKAVRKILGITSNERAIKTILEIVSEEYDRPMTKAEKDRFKVAFVISVVTCLIAPPLKNDYFLTYYWGALCVPEQIKDYNWAGLAREEILSTGSRVIGELKGGNKTSNLNGCPFGLQVYYLDNLELRDDNLPHDEFPRWKVYDQKVLGRIIKRDAKTAKNSERMVYGHLAPRDPSTVCYSRNLISRVTNPPINILGTEGSTRDTEEDRAIGEIAGILVGKVAKYASRCQASLQIATEMGNDANRKHSETWDRITRETMDTVRLDTRRLLSEIKEIVDVAKRGKKRKRAANEQASKSSPHVTSKPIPARNDEGLDGTSEASAKTVTGMTGPDLDAAHANVRSDLHEQVDRAEGKLDELYEAAMQDQSNMQIVLSGNQAGYQQGRTWLYGADSEMNKDVDQFDLGFDFGNTQVSEEVPLSMVPPSKACQDQLPKTTGTTARPVVIKLPLRKTDLMTEFSAAATPAGMSVKRSNQNKISKTAGRAEGVGSQSHAAAGSAGNKDEAKNTEADGYMFPAEASYVGGQVALSTPVQQTGKKGKSSGPSPVSLNKELAAAELDMREEIDETTINLNVAGSQGSFISLPQPRRRVKPGKYARSPFVMGYDPPTRAPADAVKIYAMFFKEKAEVDKDVWVISTAPKYVELTAGLLKNMLKKDGVVENELLTVLMRRYQQMDVSFARERGEGCWRFFMDPDFANHVMREDHLVTNPYIRDMFIGNHINFDVNLCTEFVLPVKFNFIWSTYIWDFIKKSIFVLDPTMNNGDESDKVLQANHRRVAQKLHHEIAKCIKAFFIGWSPEMDKWKTYFPRWTCPAISKRHHSGVYAAHFARYWMGKKLKRHLSEEQDDGVNQSKMGMLVDVLGLEGNIGQVPTRYRSCLPICSD